MVATAPGTLTAHHRNVCDGTMDCVSGLGLGRKGVKAFGIEMVKHYQIIAACKMVFFFLNVALVLVSQGGAHYLFDNHLPISLENGQICC